MAPLPELASQSLLLEDRVELPRLYLSWHSPAMFSPGDAELDLAADVLAHGKTSRLYRQLVYEQRVATDVSAYQHSRELSGLFQIACTAAAGVTLAVLEQAAMQAVDSLAADGPTVDELARAAAYYACWALDAADPAEAHRAATMAAAFAADGLYRVGADVIQVHGGIGYTWEHDAHLFYKRLLTLQGLGGGAADHLEELATLVLD